MIHYGHIRKIDDFRISTAKLDALDNSRSRIVILW